jgi:hypothetical protein
MRFLLIFFVLVPLFGCTTTHNTKINSDNVIFVEKVRPVVLIRDPHNPYKKSEK